MKPAAGTVSFERVLLFFGMIVTLLSLGGCYYPGYYDPYYYPYDDGISYNPPAIDFYYSDRHSSFSYSGYPFYYPYYPYQQPRQYYYPYYRFYP
jgi:hypothetical protein